MRSSLMARKATILSVAESTHYLVGLSESHVNLTALPNHSEVALCNSLAQAKDLLRQNNFQTAELIFQTAYDEMCGMSAPELAFETISLK